MAKIQEKITSLEKNLTDLRTAKVNMEKEVQTTENYIIGGYTNIEMNVYYAKIRKIKEYDIEISKKEAKLEKLKVNQVKRMMNDKIKTKRKSKKALDDLTVYDLDELLDDEKVS